MRVRAGKAVRPGRAREVGHVLHAPDGAHAHDPARRVEHDDRVRRGIDEQRGIAAERDECTRARTVRVRDVGQRIEHDADHVQGRVHQQQPAPGPVVQQHAAIGQLAHARDRAQRLRRHRRGRRDALDRRADRRPGRAVRLRERDRRRGRDRREAKPEAWTHGRHSRMITAPASTNSGISIIPGDASPLAPTYIGVPLRISAR